MGNPDPLAECPPADEVGIVGAPARYGFELEPRRERGREDQAGIAPTRDRDHVRSPGPVGERPHGRDEGLGGGLGIEARAEHRRKLTGTVSSLRPEPIHGAPRRASLQRPPARDQPCQRGLIQVGAA